jgi:hypothetical protein
MRVSSVLVATILVLAVGTNIGAAEIISCPTDLSPAHKTCAIFTDPIGAPKASPQKCDRKDCKAFAPTIDASGRKVCAFTCFRHFTPQ